MSGFSIKRDKSYKAVSQNDLDQQIEEMKFAFGDQWTDELNKQLDSLFRALINGFGADFQHPKINDHYKKERFY